MLAVVEAAGGKATDIVRLTWYVLDKRDYLSKRKEVGEAYRAVMGRHFPAMTLVVVSGLVEDEALLEIEMAKLSPTTTPAGYRTAFAGLRVAQGWENR